MLNQTGPLLLAIPAGTTPTQGCHARQTDSTQAKLIEVYTYYVSIHMYPLYSSVYL